MDEPTAQVDVVVIGAGQAGLSAAYFLAHRGFARHDDFVVLDANPQPGGAWQHRWPTLTMDEVHGIHDLPGLELDDADPDAPAEQIMADYFARYESTFELPSCAPRPLKPSTTPRADGWTWPPTPGPGAPAR